MSTDSDDVSESADDRHRYAYVLGEYGDPNVRQQWPTPAFPAEET